MVRFKKPIIAFFVFVISLQIALAQGISDIKELVPLGQTTGIKLFTDGIMVVGISTVMTSNGEVSPCKAAGIMEGDIIKTIDKKDVNSNEMLKGIVEKSHGREMEVNLVRNSHEMSVNIKPQKNTEGEYKIGVWIRDSMAGIGTLTFYEPKNNIFGALGHGICDSDTNMLVPFGNGSLMESTVVDIKKGTPGTPGELIGDYNLSEDYALIKSNTNGGIYGNMLNKDSFASLKPIPICSKQQVKTGHASIYSNVEGSSVSEYSIDILRIYPDENGDTKNMLIQITDPRLIEKTGGIVQGMSGSPIIQNGKLIGAVTHVLVNDPKKGYGIFIENMLRAAYENI